MKIAISSSGKDMESRVHEFFGRSPNFIIATLENGKIAGTVVIENTVTDQTRGAGTSSAKIVADQGVYAVIAGNVGPRAMEVFFQFGIKIYISSGTVKSAIDDFLGGKLKEIK